MAKKKVVEIEKENMCHQTRVYVCLSDCGDDCIFAKHDKGKKECDFKCDQYCRSSKANERAWEEGD